MEKKTNNPKTRDEEIKMKPVFIASAPNAEPDDRRIALRLLFSPRKWRKRKNLDEVSTQLAEMHSVSDSFAFNNGRAALASILSAIPVEKGDEVITQAYTCLAVPLAITWAGGVPVYADIPVNSFNATCKDLLSKINSKTRAVIVQHTFGEPSPIEEIITAIDKENTSRPESRKIYLIEDCAHCLGTHYKESLLGTWGDAVFFSFGQEKVISCTRGGIALSKDPELSRRLAEIHSSSPEQSASDIIKSLLHPILWNLISTTYFFPSFTGKATLGRFFTMLFKSVHLLEHQANPASISSPPVIQKLSEAHAVMLNNQLRKLPRYLKHRAHISNIYNSVLPNKFRIHAKNHGYLRFPLRVSDPKSLENHLKKNRIIAGNWYASPIHPMFENLSRLNYKTGACPNAERATKESLNLPTGPNVSTLDAERVAETVLTYLSD